METTGDCTKAFSLLIEVRTSGHPFDVMVVGLDLTVTGGMGGKDTL